MNELRAAIERAAAKCRFSAAGLDEYPNIIESEIAPLFAAERERLQSAWEETIERGRELTAERERREAAERESQRLQRLLVHGILTKEWNEKQSLKQRAEKAEADAAAMSEALKWYKTRLHWWWDTNEMTNRAQGELATDAIDGRHDASKADKALATDAGKALLDRLAKLEAVKEATERLMLEPDDDWKIDYLKDALAALVEQ